MGWPDGYAKRTFPGDQRQLELKFVDANVDLPMTVNTGSPTRGGRPPFSSFRSPFGHQSIAGSVVSC